MAASAHLGLVEGSRARGSLHSIGHTEVKDESAAFVTILRACTKHKDFCKGVRLHNDILRKGLLEKCSDALVTMYAKAGTLTQAKELFEMYKSTDVVTWTALLAGCVQKGQAQSALAYFKEMKKQGLSPDAVTFTCILKACGSMGEADIGEEIHIEIVKHGLLGKSVVLGNALLDMYVKCGALAKAQQVLEKLPARNVISWTTLITGYTQQNEGEQALNCFHLMQCEGLSPNAVTFICALKACGISRAAEEGEKIHEAIAEQGLLRSNIELGAALVDMYAKCGALGKAREVLEGLPIRNAISWTALIAEYIQQGEGAQALDCYDQMRHEGFTANAVTCLCILKACGSIGAADKGEKIHYEIAEQKLLENDLALGNALVDMYAKCGALTKARCVLEELPVRDVVSWNALISAYAQQGQAEETIDCFERMQHDGITPDKVTFLCIMKACGSLEEAQRGEKIHVRVAKQGLLLGESIMLGNALVDMYAKCGALAKARHVLEELPIRNITSWNALTAQYVEQGQAAQAVNCFEEMQQEGLSPDTVTFTCILKACSTIKALRKGEEVHDKIAKQGLLRSHMKLGTALVDMYAKCGAFAKAEGVLDVLLKRDVASWNALLTGYVEHCKMEQALDCFERILHENLSPDAVTFLCILKVCSDIGSADKVGEVHDEIIQQGLQENDMLGGALVDMYSRSGALSKAKQVLEELPVRNVISWTTLIAGYVQEGDGVEALLCYEQMLCEGVSPNALTLTCILKACGSIGALDKGEEIQEEIAKQGFLRNNTMLGTALADMYAKCGALEKAQQVLAKLSVWDVVSWNALVRGYAQQCGVPPALTCHEDPSPDAARFSCLLNACSRLGLTENARTLFSNMSTLYGIRPGFEHYACMVDLYSRAGQLDKAVGVIEKMPSSNTGVWSALLGACLIWGDVNVGRWAFEHAVRIDKGDAIVYIVMAKVYGGAGMQSDAESIEAMRIANKAWKTSTGAWLMDVGVDVSPA